MFLKYINWFRGLAILFVVFSHAIPLLHWGDQNTVVRSIYRALFVEGTTLFVFISGYLFEHLKPKYEPRRYFTSKLKNVIVPYLVVSVPAIAIYVLGIKTEHNWILTREFVDSSPLYQIAMFLLTGAHLGPLWYIPMACLLFLVSPLLLALSTRGHLNWLLIPLLGVSLVVSKPDQNASVPQAFVHYLFVYAFGMIASLHKEAIGQRLVGRRAIGMLTMLFVALVGLLVGLYVADLPGQMNVMFIQKVVLCVLSIAALGYMEKQGAPPPFLDQLASASFGIFFIHGYIIALLSQVFDKLEHPPSGPLFYLPLSALVSAVSYLIVVAVRRVFGRRSRYLIGC